MPLNLEGSIKKVLTIFTETRSNVSDGIFFFEQDKSNWKWPSLLASTLTFSFDLVHKPTELQHVQQKTNYNNCRDWSAYFSRPVIYDTKRSYKSNKLEQKKSLPANEKKVWQLSN